MYLALSSISVFELATHQVLHHGPRRQRPVLGPWALVGLADFSQLFRELVFGVLAHHVRGLRGHGVPEVVRV